MLPTEERKHIGGMKKHQQSFHTRADAPKETETGQHSSIHCEVGYYQCAQLGHQIHQNVSACRSMPTDEEDTQDRQEMEGVESKL